MLDVTNEIFPDETFAISEADTVELYETCYRLMEEFIQNNPKLITEEDFEEVLYDNITELIFATFEEDAGGLFFTEEFQEEIHKTIDYAYFFLYPKRSYPDSVILKEPDTIRIQHQLDILRNKYQPQQRTPQWYQFRHNLITASNAYKAFESQAVKNSLIYEKCLPLVEPEPESSDKNISGVTKDTNSGGVTKDTNIKEIRTQVVVSMVNTNSSLHWGNKYEPLSIIIYEDKYGTKVSDFGCIQHDKYSFLGASPDGINVDPKSSRYGRMLEVKNIVNREITGIPKKEYWVQMQMQMEVCDLDECDFLETKFVEYEDRNAFIEDTSDDVLVDEDDNEFQDSCLSKDGKVKGEIIYFHRKDGTPFYVYKDLDCIHKDDIREWESTTVDTYERAPYGYMFMKIIYWKLECISCVLVCRNKEWFKNNIWELEEIWDTIKKERVTGYQHRAPIKRVSKADNECETIEPYLTSGVCLLNVIKNEPEAYI